MELENTIVAEILRAQQNGAPLVTYRKAIMGRLVVRVLDPYRGIGSEVMLQGDPRKTEPTELEVSLYTPLEVKYFEKYNRTLIEKGSLVPVSSAAELLVNRVNALSDEEIDTLVTASYFTLTSKLAEVTSEVTLQRILEAAERLNRPAKTLNTIKARIATVQQV